jgi:hypothetical protein
MSSFPGDAMPMSASAAMSTNTVELREVIFTSQ